MHVLPAAWIPCQNHSSNSMHQLWYLSSPTSLTSSWEVGLFPSTWTKPSSNLCWRNTALTLPILATTALFRISHSSRRSWRGLWLLVWRSICLNTVCVRACNRHTNRIFYWNCIGQSEERYPDFHGQKPMCSACAIGPLRSLWYGQSFKASESAATSDRSRRDSTHVVWVIRERTHTGSSHPLFNRAIRWTATGSAARKRSRTHIVHDLHISPRRHRTPSWHQGALLCRWYIALCFVWHQGQSIPSRSSNGGMCRGHQYVDGRQSSETKRQQDGSDNIHGSQCWNGHANRRHPHGWLHHSAREMCERLGSCVRPSHDDAWEHNQNVCIVLLPSAEHFTNPWFIDWWDYHTARSRIRVIPNWLLQLASVWNTRICHQKAATCAQLGCPCRHAFVKVQQHNADAEEIALATCEVSHNIQSSAAYLQGTARHGTKLLEDSAAKLHAFSLTKIRDWKVTHHAESAPQIRMPYFRLCGSQVVEWTTCEH